jgi:hypothetical protein
MQRQRRDRWVSAWVTIWVVGMAISLRLSWHEVRRLTVRNQEASGKQEQTQGVNVLCRSSSNGHSNRYRVRLAPPRIERLTEDGRPWHAYGRVERVGPEIVAYYSYHQGGGMHNDQLRFRSDLQSYRNDTIWIRPDRVGQIIGIPPGDQGRCERLNS